MKTLFEGDRRTLSEALDLTVDSLRSYGPRYEHWCAAYSGGKDSTAAVTVLTHLLATGRVRPPSSLTVLYADTRMELPPLHCGAVAMLEMLRSRGHQARVVLPALDDRFFVYVFGRGVAPPSNTFRWCTPRLKIKPMQGALKDLRDRSGGKVLMLTGVRLGESAARDGRISLSCSRDGAECGQGWFQATTPESIADTLAPLLHWRACHVWDWLTLYAPADGWPTHHVAAGYGLGEEGSEHEKAARTGCVGCNLASRDLALERTIRQPDWDHLVPLKRLKSLYAELKRPHRRLRKDGWQRRADGSLASNPNRLGPLTLGARLWGLGQVLGIQAEVNAAAAAQGRPEYSLINAEEESRIRELIARGTWPDRWSGDEPTGDRLLPEVNRDGSAQPWLFGE